jgi:regulator of cell morphogenesis and NO signaling
MESIAQRTLGNIVRSHHAAAGVFEKYHLDFCCKGKRPLAEACLEAGIPVESVVKELEAIIQNDDSMVINENDAVQLIGRILLKHHFYVRQSVPAIQYHLQKVVTKHGERYPHMIEVNRLFQETAEELIHHMQKEEMILFPRIQQVYHAAPHQYLPPNFLSGPIAVMESEHTHAGENLYAIRKLLNNYTAPEDACTTHRLVIDELKAFEEDLHQHVHLENNVLFPLGEKLLTEKMETAF